MYPLLELGPLRLSSGGLMLLIGVLLGQWLLGRIAMQRGGAELAAQAEQATLPALLGALIGARLLYGLLNLDLYAADPLLFLSLRLAELSWPGALLGGTLAALLATRGARRRELADAAALALPPVHALAAFGLLLSGEAFGEPTSLPWAIPLFGATRHPTQIYYLLAALLIWLVIQRLSTRSLPPGTLAAVWLALHGLAMLLIEAVRADAPLLPEGVRAVQVFGTLCILAALRWLRANVADLVPRAAAPIRDR